MLCQPSCKSVGISLACRVFSKIVCLQESVAAFKDFSASDAAGAAPKKKPAPKKALKQEAAPAAPQPPKKQEAPPQQPAPKPKQPSGTIAVAQVLCVRAHRNAAVIHLTVCTA